ncbi:MAG: hypothetical protein ACLP3B_08500 [Syntrophobacteraceae bacterium]
MGIFETISKDYGCKFEALEGVNGLEKVSAFSTKLYSGFCDLFANANYLTFTEWGLRHYHSAKRLILSALFFTQSEYLSHKNTPNLALYSMYYGMFNGFASNLYLLPYLPLKLVQQVSHTGLFKAVDNHFIKYGIYGESLTDLFNTLRLCREAYSYKLPISAKFVRKEDQNSLQINDLMCKLGNVLPAIFQTSELLSYLSFYAWDKKVGEQADDYEKFQDECNDIFFSFLEIHDHLGKYCLVDDEDYSRQGWVLRRFSSTFPLSWITTTTLCDDLECYWRTEKNDTTEGDEYDICKDGEYISNCI